MPPDTNVAPHIAAGMTQGPDGTWGFPDSAPAATTPPATGASTPPAAAAPLPHIAAGLVQASDGTWGFPDTPYTPPPPAAPAPAQDATQPAADGTKPAPSAIPKSVENQELRNQPWYQAITDTIDGVQGSIAHGLTYGANEIIAPLPNAIANSIKNGIPFTQAYDDEVKKQRQARLNFEGKHPDAGLALEVAAGVPGAAVMSPLFEAAPVAGPIAEPAGQMLLRGARNIAAGAGTGAATGFTSTDGDIQDRLRGATEGLAYGGLSVPAANAVHGIVKVVGAPLQAAKTGMLTSTEANAQRAVGNALNEAAGPGGVVANPSPIPGMPLNVAQAGNPGLATMVDRLGNTAEGLAARKAEESAQNQALLGHLPGDQRGAGAPETAAGRASAAATQNIRDASDIIGARESQLWNAPVLTQQNITTDSMKGEVNNYVTQLRQNNPGLGDAYDHSDLPGIVRDLNARPDMDSASELNSLSSRARKIARAPDTPDPVRRVATELGTAIQDAFANSPEVAGRPAIPARAVPPGWEHDPKLGGDVWSNGRTEPAVPAIPANPAITDALTAARDFTRREATVLGHSDFNAILKRNSQGNYINADENGLNKFFNFAQGNMQPGQIKDVGGFLDDISSEMRRLNSPAVGGFHPAAVDAVRTNLVNNTRDFVTAKLLSEVQTNTLDRAGDQIIALPKISNWIRRNSGMLQSSGVFDAGQLAAIDRVGQAAEMIHQGQSQGKAVGSDTFTRLNGTNFIDAFLPKGVASKASFTIGTALGGVLGSLTGGPLGGLIGAGLTGGVERAGLGNALMNKLFTGSQQRANELLNEIIRDPVKARDLSMKATPQNAAKWSPETKQWIRALLTNQPVDQGLRLNSDEKLRAAQQGQQPAPPGG